MVFLSQGKADPLYISWMSFHAVATLPSPLVGALAHWDIFWMGFNMQTCFTEVFLQWSLMLIHELTLDNCPSHPQCRCHTTMFTAPLFNVRKVIAKHEYSNMTRLPLWENETFTSVLDIHTYIENSVLIWTRLWGPAWMWSRHCPVVWILVSLTLPDLSAPDFSSSTFNSAIFSVSGWFCQVGNWI